MTAREQRVSFRRRLGGGIAKRLGRGTILLFPLLLTLWLLKFAFDTLDGLLQPAISAVLGQGTDRPELRHHRRCPGGGRSLRLDRSLQVGGSRD